MIKNKFFNALTIVLILMQAILPINALAMTSTDQPDYTPGSVVTIYGDNSDDAGFLPGESVHVDVMDATAAVVLICDAIADEAGAWICQMILAADASAGTYSYTATGQTSGASQSGVFTVTVPPPPTVEPTQEPTQEPTIEPTLEPTVESTQEPTTVPSTTPTSEPTVEPTATAAPALPPFIRSDKDDYAPGELVTFTSRNWQPGESVHLIVNDVIGDSWRLSVGVLADENGAFIYQFNLPDWFVAQYHVYAYGAVSGATTWDFTDARVVTTATLNGGASVTVATGASIPVVVNVTTDGTGANSRWRSTGWRISTTIPGAVTCVNHTDHDAAGTNSESFSITAPLAPGTYNAYFIAYSNDICTQGNSNTFTLASAVIVKSNQTITFGALANKTFGDAAFTVSATANSGLTVTFSTTTPSVCTSSGTNGATITIVGAGTCTVQADQAGNATFFPAPSVQRSFTVAQASSTTAVSCPASVIYTGAALVPCTVSVTGAGGLSLTPSATYTNNINVGTATASYIYAGDANHTGSSDSRTFAVTQAPSTTIVTCPASVTYTGSPLTPCSATVTGAGGLNQSLTVSYSNNTSVGTANANASFAGDANHTGSNDSETFAITQASTTTTVTCPANVTYDGFAQTPCTANVTGAGGLNQSLTVNYLNNTNAGTANASASYAGDANHTSSSDSKSFIIDPAASTTTVMCPTNVTYTGLPLTPCTANVTGAGGLNQSLTVSYSNNTNAGTANASASYAGDVNHTASSDSEIFTIDPATSTTTVTCPTNVTYNGLAQTPCSASYETEDGLSGSLTVNYSDNTNAGVATASANYAGDANHTGSIDTETFTIDRAATTTTVTCAAGPFTYTGSSIEPCTANVTGAGGLNESLTVDYSDNIEAGVAIASASYAESANYLASSDSETFTIDKATTTTTVTCAAGPFTYTGSPIEPCTASVTGAGGLNQSLTVSYSDNTDAGVATASASFVGDANHTGSNDSKTFTIDKAATATTVTCAAGPFTYTGLPIEPCTASVTGAGGLNESLTVSYTDNTDAGEATASASYAESANYLGSSDSETFTIDPASSTTTMTCPTNVTYDGSAQTPCSASYETEDGLSGSLTVNYSNNTDAGEATASASYTGDANHIGSNDSENFTIDKAATSTIVTCAAGPFTYTGSPIEPCAASVTGAGGLNESLTVSYSNNTNAGVATASASYAESANYLGSSDSENFTINQAASVTVVTCQAGPFVYDGFAFTPCTASVAGAGGLNESLTVSYTDNTNAGEATASASYAESANYLGSSDSETFTIDPAGSTTTVTCPANVTYDGSAQTPCSASYETEDGLSGSLAVSYLNNTNAGTATASASYAGDANHTGSNDSETFVIDQAASVTVVVCASGPFVYDGSALTPCTASVTGAGGLDQSLTVSYTDNVNAGTVTASASFAGAANHTSSSHTENFEIDKAASVTVVTCAAGPFTYNGAAQTPCSASVTGDGGLNESLTVSYTDNVNAGTATASASYAGDANHTGSNDSQTFEIDQAASVTVVTCAAGPFTYNGLAQEPCSVSVTGAGSLNLTPNPVYTNNINAGTATASYEYTGDLNHTGSNDSKTFIIGQAASVTTVTCPTNVTYTGSALQPCTATATGAGGLNQPLAVNYIGNVNAGTATASASFAGDANHTGSSDSETFIIDPAPSVTTVTCAAGPFIYNGSTHTPCTAAVTGAGGLNQPLTVSYINNVNAGTVTANASYVGDANHTGSSDSENFTIAQATSTATVTCPASVVFTGSPQTPCSAAVTGVGGLNQALTVTYLNNTNVGTATASATYAGDANHTGSTGSRTFAITPWALTGFYQPVDMYGVLNIIRGGSTVPLKFEVFAGATELTNVSAIKPITYIEISCATMSTALLDEIETTATGGTSLRYDSTSGQFIYNWKTPNTTGRCYRVTMTTIDNSTLVAYFKTK